MTTEAMAGKSAENERKGGAGNRSKFVSAIITIIAVSAGLFHLYTGAFGSFSTMTQLMRLLRKKAISSC
jgi:hypothetical protein